MHFSTKDNHILYSFSSAVIVKSIGLFTQHREYCLHTEWQPINGCLHDAGFLFYIIKRSNRSAIHRLLFCIFYVLTCMTRLALVTPQTSHSLIGSAGELEIDRFISIFPQEEKVRWLFRNYHTEFNCNRKSIFF